MSANDDPTRIESDSRGCSREFSDAVGLAEALIPLHD
jgi:hypothetical protein